MKPEKLQIVAPFDLEPIEQLSMHQLKDAESRLSVAEKLEKQPLPKHLRLEILSRTLLILESRKAQLIENAAREGGKPLDDSTIEIERGFEGIRIAISELQNLAGREIPMGHSEASEGRLALTIREPIGTVVAISAFNHPFNLIVHQVIPAVATGCPVIVKPALTTPLSCLAIIDALREAGLPSGWAESVLLSDQDSQRLAEDPRVRFLSFIGSEKVGWLLRSKLSPGVRCALELGGAAPVIVEKDAAVAEMLPSLTKGGFYHAGQVCVSVQRIFVQQDLAAEVADTLAELATRQRVGDPLDAATQIGPLIKPQEVDRVDKWVKEATEAGATLLTGGEAISETCYQPTVLFDPPINCTVSTKEIFGPVICVYPFANRLAAVEQANSLPYSFQAAVFSKNIDTAMQTAKELDAAAVMINDHSAFRVDWMPFGGRRASGLGVGGIPYTFRDYTEEKLLVIKIPKW